MWSPNQACRYIVFPPSDARLAGVRAALAQLELPASDSAFDDVMRRLDAITRVKRVEPSATVTALADIRRGKELRAFRLRHRVMARSVIGSRRRGMA